MTTLHTFTHKCPHLIPSIQKNTSNLSRKCINNNNSAHLVGISNRRMRNFHHQSFVLNKESFQQQQGNENSSSPENQQNNNNTPQANSPPSTAPDSTQKTPDQLKREEVLKQLRNHTFMAPKNDEEAALQRRRRRANAQLANQQQQQQEQDTSSTLHSSQEEGHDESAISSFEDRYAFVKTLSPAKYLASREGGHFWNVEYLLEDDEGQDIVPLQVQLKHAAMLKEKYATEDLVLAVHKFLASEPADLQNGGVHIPTNVETEIKGNLQSQIFLDPEETEWGFVKSFLNDATYRKYMYKNAFALFCAIWLLWTVFMATAKAIQKSKVVKKENKKKNLETLIKEKEALEKARDRRIAAGLPMSSDFEERLAKAEAAVAQAQ